jgi:hypothetical protein
METVAAEIGAAAALSVTCPASVNVVGVGVGDGDVVVLFPPPKRLLRAPTQTRTPVSALGTVL